MTDERTEAMGVDEEGAQAVDAVDAADATDATDATAQALAEGETEQAVTAAAAQAIPEGAEQAASEAQAQDGGELAGDLGAQATVDAMDSDPDIQIVDMTPDEPAPESVEHSPEEIRAATAEFFSIPGFEQSEAVLKKRKKTKIGIVVVVIVAVVLVVAAYFVLSSAQSQRGSDTVVESEVIDEEELDLSTHTEADFATTVPNLCSLFGQNSDAVAASLGSQYVCASTDGIDEGDLKTKVIYVYTPSDADFELSDPPTVTAYLNSEGNVAKVEYSSSMVLCGLESDLDFSELVANADVLNSVLSQSGVSQQVSSYSAPAVDAYTTYEDPEASTKVVSREAASFNGATGNSGAPTDWQLSFSYVYDNTQAQTSGSVIEPQRTLSLTLQ